jgi:ABC-2 type transport system ATP-binding protein
MIELHNLKKRYGQQAALDIEDLIINKGESFGLVGNNGAGKTTMFRLILDLIEASEGEATSNGENVKQSEHWKSYTGSYLDEGFLISFLTPKEYLKFVAGLYGLGENDISELVEFSDGFVTEDLLKEKKLIRDLSKGNKSKVGIITALMGNPEIIVLDEPFAHLDPSSQIRLKNMIKNLNSEKAVTFLVSSHDLKHVTEVCNRIVLLEDGRAIKDILTERDTLRDLEEYFAV